ncbi:MAG: DUF4281 domain-containing protein [Elusimicrobia bacterium]|nr:DUF4281 domain-containing protein [Elusimicrobiota bacterium]
MGLERLFTVCVVGIVPAWLLLIFAPNWKWTQKINGGYIPSILLAVVHAFLVLVFWRDSAGDFSSLAGVSRTFQTPGILLAGWVHYLAFDLMVGTWELQDSHKHAIPHAFLIPCLVLTFLLGPMGFLAYVILRTVWVFAVRPDKADERSIVK